eukprot:scaffold268_cov236-Pinguiococcus_pyrenoidosus.AAC.23
MGAMRARQKDVENAVVQNAAAFGKTVHVDANHCWTYSAIQSTTGTTFTPGPEQRRASPSEKQVLQGFRRSPTAQRRRARAWRASINERTR